MPSTALDDGNIMYNTIFILHKGNAFLNHDISKFKFHYCAIVSIYTLLILFYFYLLIFFPELKVQDFQTFSLRRGSKLTRLYLSYIFVYAFSKITTFLNIISSKFFFFNLT